MVSLSKLHTELKFDIARPQVTTRKLSRSPIYRLLVTVLIGFAMMAGLSGHTRVWAQDATPTTMNVGTQGPLLLAIEPSQELAPLGQGVQAKLNIRASRAIDVLKISLTSSENAQVQGDTAITIPVPEKGIVQDLTASYVVSGVGNGEFHARIEGLSDAGETIVAVRGVIYFLASEDEVLYGLTGPLELQLKRLTLDHERMLLELQRQGNLQDDTRADLERVYQAQYEAIFGGGAQTEISASVSAAAQESSAQANITVSGRVEWNDSRGNPHPVRLAKVEIRDQEASGSELVTTVETDLDGNYSATVNNNDGSGENGRDIFVRVLAESSGFSVRNAADNVYRINSDPMTDVADGANLVIDLDADTTANNHTAFSVHDALVMAIRYTVRVHGQKLSDIDVIFPEPTNGSFYDGDLHIQRGDRFDWDVIHHEYGHHVMNELDIENSPGGCHVFQDNLAEPTIPAACAGQPTAPRDKDNGTRLAWGEGWPTYFGTVLQQVQGGAGFNIPNVGDTRYTETEESTFGYSLETGGDSNGEDNELSVQRILWDLFDTNNDVGDDGIALSHSTIWNTLNTADVTTISGAYQVLVSGRPIREVAQIGCIFSEHNVAPDPTSPPDQEIVGLAPPTLRWFANGGGPSNRHNQFIVELYDAQFNNLLFSSAPQTGTTYTPSQAQWDTILSQAGARINWLVQGSQTNSPTTGPYRSCGHIMIPGADLAVTKSDSPDPVIAGTELEYTITIQNRGPVTSRNSTVTDTLPPGLTLVSAAPSQGSCNTASPVTCDLGNIANGQSATIIIKANVDPDQPEGTIVNTVTARNEPGDPDLSNNMATAQTEVIRRADLAITATPLTQQVTAGGRFQYVLEVVNNGPSSATAAQIVNKIAADITHLSDDSGCVENPTRTLTCDLDKLAPGESKKVSITALTHAILADETENTVTAFNSAEVINPAEEDPDLSNNKAEAEVKIFSTRVGSGTLVFYSFEEQEGASVHDLSGVNGPINLNIDIVTSTAWIEGGLVVSSPTTIASASAAMKVIEAAQPTNELTIEAWIVPENATQEGPARIVTLSNDPHKSNFTLGQGRWHNQPSELYDVRLRTTHTSEDGRPSTLTPNGVLKTELTHVVYTRRADDSVATLYINGERKAVRTVGGDFTNWAKDYRLALAHEVSGDHPWLGEYQLVAIFDRALNDDEVWQNYQAGPDGDEPITGSPVVEDLFGYAYEVWTDPAAPRAQSVTKLGIVAHRLSGKQVLNDVVVRVYHGDPSASGTVIGDAEVDWLSPREWAISSSVEWTAPKAGVYDIFVVIDPDNAIAEKDETNNVIHRKITVLDPADDELAPHVDSFLINGGSTSTTQPELELAVTASDPEPGAVDSVAFVEYDFDNDVGEWVTVQTGAWISHTSELTLSNWTLQPMSGLKYLQAWARDNAGNISLYPYQQYINYLPPTETLNESAGTFYRYTVKQGQYLIARVEPVSGDPDLYLWSPDYKDGRPAWVSNLSEGVDEVILRAPVDGVYQVEVYGYTATEFRLIVEVADTAPDGVVIAAGVDEAQVAGISPDKLLLAGPLAALDNAVSILRNPFLAEGQSQRSQNPVYLPYIVR